jgi:Domain of unknown function (DUF4403)
MHLTPRFAGLAVVMAVIGGCAISPKAPPHTTSTAAVPVVDVSVVQIPFHLDLNAVKQQINANIPQSQDGFGAWGDAGGGWLDETGWQRDTINVSASGHSLIASTTVHYAGALAHRVGKPWPLSGSIVVQVAQCGRGEPEPTLGLSLVASLTPKPDWSVVPEVTVPEPQIGARCRLGIINYDISQRIADSVHTYFNNQVNTLTQALTQRLAFHDQAQHAWSLLENPISLGGGAFLQVDPQSADLGALAADPDGGGVTVLAGLRAKPVVLFGGLPATVTAPLPPLQAADGTLPMIHIELPVQVGYDALSDAIDSRLKGRQYPFGKYKVTIDEVRVYGTEQLLVVEVHVSGTARGTLYLTGAPVYNAATQTVYVESLVYTLETKNALLKAADWLLHEHFEQILQSEAHLDITNSINTLREATLAGINRHLDAHADLSGNITAVRPLGVVLSESGVTAYFVGDGTVAVSLH